MLRFKLMIDVVLCEAATSIRKEAQHEAFAGLDVSVKETSICIVDETGRICHEMKVVSHPDDLAEVLTDASWNFARVGLRPGRCRNGCSGASRKPGRQ